MVSVLGFSFSGQRPERRARLRHAEALGRAQGRRALGAGARRPRLRRAVGRARRLHLRAQPAADSRARHRHRLHLPPAGPRRQRPRGAAGGAQPAARHGGAEQGARRRAARRPGRRAAAAARHRPRPGQRAGRLVRQHQRASRPRSARPTSTTSRTPAGCSAWSCRPTRRRACSPTTCCASTCNNQGKPVPLSAFATTRWITGPMQTIRYNGYPTMRIAGDAAPGYSTGDAMDEMERLAAQLPAGFAFEWTGQSREEKLGARRPRSCSPSRCWRCSCAWRRCTRAGRSRCRGDAGGAAGRARARCSARPCAACRTTSSSRSA